MPHVGNGALAVLRLERAVEHRQVFLVQAGRVFDRAGVVDVVDDRFDLGGRVTQAAQRPRHRLVDDLDHAAADELLVLHQRDVRLNARRVAVHHERDRPRWREHRGLCVAKTKCRTKLQCIIPRAVRRVDHLRWSKRCIYCTRIVTVFRNYAQHGLTIFVERGERTDALSDAGGGRVRMSRHDRGDRAGVRAAAIGVVWKAKRHQQRAEIRITQTELTHGDRVLGDLQRRVARVADDDLLRPDRHRYGAPKRLDIERIAFIDELHQVERSEVAGGVIDVHVLRARVAGVDARGVCACVPVVDRRVVLHARITARPCRRGDALQQLARAHGLHRLAFQHGDQIPVAAFGGGAHELIGDPDRVVGVLELDGRPGIAVQRHVPAGVAQGVRLPLLVHLTVDKLFDIRVVDVQDDHLGRPPRLAAGLDGAGDAVGAAHEADGPAGSAARRKLLLARPDRRQVDAGARPALEDHPFGLAPVQDGIHGVIDRQDEAGRALRLVFDADVEPDGAVERHFLVDEQVRQLVVERPRFFIAQEVTVIHSPAGDRVDHAADHLLHAALACGCAELAAEVLGDDDVRRRLRPSGRDLDVLLFEERLAGLVGDGGGAVLPRDVLERIIAGAREVALDGECGGVA